MTFEQANSDVILPSEEKELTKKGKMTKEEVRAYNKESTSQDPGNGPLSIEDVILDDDIDPLIATVKESDADFIEGYTEEDHKAEQRSQDLAREAYRKWQAQQPEWTFFVFKSFDPKTRKKVWEKRTYRVRDLISEQTDEIQKIFRDIEFLETRKNYLQFLAPRNKEHLEEWNKERYGDRIAKLIKDIQYKRMEYYFGETNKGIIDRVRTVDLRDQIDAAIDRENKLPLSRKRVSSRSMSRENTSVETGKK